MKAMDKGEMIKKMRKMSIEQKLALLSETEEAYIRGFIEGAIVWGYQTQKQNGQARSKSPKASQKHMVSDAKRSFP
jgi:hypothetical protein